MITARKCGFCVGAGFRPWCRLRGISCAQHHLVHGLPPCQGNSSARIRHGHSYSASIHRLHHDIPAARLYLCVTWTTGKHHDKLRCAGAGRGDLDIVIENVQSAGLSSETTLWNHFFTVEPNHLWLRWINGWFKCGVIYKETSGFPHTHLKMSDYM